MSVTLIALLSVLRLAPVQAPTVEDGVRAMLRGDYGAAAAAFRPFSDGANPDPAAQFLMGVLLLSPRSGQSDQGRACGLFTSVSASTHVFAQASMDAADALRQQMGPGAGLFCTSRVAPESVPVSFTLGPNHRVDIAGTSWTVSYNGAEKRVMGGYLPGMVPLPIRYLAFDVSRPVPVRRHFLVTLVWSPDSVDAPANWSLGWLLGEVVGLDILPVTAERSLVTFPGAQPPPAQEVDRFFRLFVNADGDVEWNAGPPDNLKRGIAQWRPR